MLTVIRDIRVSCLTDSVKVLMDPGFGISLLLVSTVLRADELMLSQLFTGSVMLRSVADLNLIDAYMRLYHLILRRISPITPSFPFATKRWLVTGFLAMVGIPTCVRIGGG